MGTISMKPKSLNSGNKHYLKDPKNFTSVLESFIIPIYTKGEKKRKAVSNFYRIIYSKYQMFGIMNLLSS
jgi:hypothetical protein